MTVSPDSHIANGGSVSVFKHSITAQGLNCHVVSWPARGVSCSGMGSSINHSVSSVAALRTDSSVTICPDGEPRCTHRSRLQKAGISNIAIGSATKVLAINVGLAIPWNRMRLLRQ